MLTRVGGLSPKVRIETTTKVSLSTIHKVVIKVTKVTSVSSKVVKRIEVNLTVVGLIRQTIGLILTALVVESMVIARGIVLVKVL